MNGIIRGRWRSIAALALAFSIAVAAAPPAGAEGHPAGHNVNCVGTLAAGVYHNVTVQKGQTCVLTASVHISGNLMARQDSDLRSDGATIDRNLHDNHGKALRLDMGGRIGGNLEVDHLRSAPPGATNYICDTTVGHNLHNSGSAAAAPMVIGDKTAVCAAGVTVGGNLEANNNAGALDIGDNTIAHNLHADNNKGGLKVLRNHVGQNLGCHNNNPAPTSTGNTAHKFEGQCLA